MTTAADDSAVENAFEALLAGRPVPEGAAGLVAFTEAVRTSAMTPGRPHAALAELLATGLLADQSSPSVRTARSAGSAPARQPSRVRTRRRTTVILAAFLAKFLAAGAMAQAATGATVAVVVFTGVGAAGALPEPAQDTFAAVVTTVTPFEAPTSEQTTQGTTQAPAAEESLAEGDVTEEVGTTDGGTEALPEDVVDAWMTAGPGDAETFGAWVSASAENTQLRAALKASEMSFGSVVSMWAKKKDMDDTELAAEGVDLAALSREETTGTEIPVVTEPRIPEPAATQGGSSRGTGTGNGNGNGNGNGKAGNATSNGSGKAATNGAAAGNGRGNGQN